MFFFLSKVLSFLIVPYYWILILIVCYLISKSKINKRRIKIAIIIIIIVFSNDYIYTEALKWYEPHRIIIQKGKSYSAGIVLGGMAGFNRKGEGIWSNGVERFIETEKLYHQGIIQKIIVSGGSGELLQQEFKEANFIRDQLIASGVNENDIIIETNSRNTYENAIFVKKMIDSLHFPAPYLLITSAIHMPRAEKVFNKAEIKIIPYPCFFSTHSSKYIIQRILIPDISRLYDWSFFFKEIIGLKIYELTGKA
jgi:uncharacterized SAM-binding protein YcdF (DUF218 family)